MSENNESKIVNHIFNVGLGTVVNIILGLITTPLITRIADPSAVSYTHLRAHET